MDFKYELITVLPQLELAQDATEKRRQLEVEKEMSEDLLEQYRQQAVKEKKMVEMLTEMNKAFYCELCDRQYTKYSEYDNHINSYSHHHNQVGIHTVCYDVSMMYYHILRD